MGKGLLAQLQQLKASKSAATGSHTKATSKPLSVANEVDGSADAVSEAAKPAYAAQEIALPVTAQGEVRKRASSDAAPTSTSTETALAPAPVKEARKSAVKVFRSAEVQAARMELPVCGMEQEVRALFYMT